MDFSPLLKVSLLVSAGYLLAACVPETLETPTSDNSGGNDGGSDSSLEATGASMLQNGGIYFTSPFTSIEAMSFRVQAMQDWGRTSNDLFSGVAERWALDEENNSHFEIIDIYDPENVISINDSMLPAGEVPDDLPEDERRGYIFSYANEVRYELYTLRLNFSVTDEGAVQARVPGFPDTGYNLVEQPLDIAGQPLSAMLTTAPAPGAVFSNDARAIQAQYVYADDRYIAVKMPNPNTLAFCIPVNGELAPGCTNDIKQLDSESEIVLPDAIVFHEDNTLTVTRYDEDRPGTWSKIDYANGDVAYFIETIDGRSVGFSSGYTSNVVLKQGDLIYYGGGIRAGHVIAGEDLLNAFELQYANDPRSLIFMRQVLRNEIQTAWNQQALEDLNNNQGIAFGEGKAPWGHKTWLQYQTFPQCSNADEIGEIATAAYEFVFTNGQDGFSGDIHEYWYNYEITKSASYEGFSGTQSVQAIQQHPDDSCTVINASFTDLVLTATAKPAVSGPVEIAEILEGFIPEDITSVDVHSIFKFVVNTDAGDYTFRWQR